MKESNGEYIARIDDDDEWIDKEKLKKQIEFLEKNKDYVLVGTGTVVVDEYERELFRYLGPETDVKIRNKILNRNCFTHSSVIFRKDEAMRFGGYDEFVKTKHLEDYDLWLKLGTIGKFYNLPIYATKFSLRDNSLSSKNKIEQFRKDICLIKIYKKKYPRYIQSLIFNYSRLFLYKTFRFILPNRLRSIIIKIYKVN